MTRLVIFSIVFLADFNQVTRDKLGLHHQRLLIPRQGGACYLALFCYLNQMEWGSIAIGLLMGALSYLASRMLSNIDEDLKELKKSQYVTNERLARIETKNETLIAKTDELSKLTDNVDKSVKNVDKEIALFKSDTVKALNETKYNVNETKQNFGKILIVLKGLVLKAQQHKTKADP
jgi:hypothetical protein